MICEASARKVTAIENLVTWLQLEGVGNHSRVSVKGVGRMAVVILPDTVVGTTDNGRSPI